MARDVGWTALQWPAMEHVIVAGETDGWHAAGRLVIAGHRLASAWYELRCEPDGRFADLRMSVRDARGERTLLLTATADGCWRADGEPRPDLAGCADIDLNCTPLTNTLPIRRLDWAPGQARDFAMAYVSVPELTVRPVRQRYTCLPSGADKVSAAEVSAVFRYETATFRADLPVDDDGLVLDYPGCWSRIPALRAAAS